MSKPRFTRSVARPHTESLKFELRTQRLVEVGASVSSSVFTHMGNAYSVDRISVKKALAYLDKNPNGSTEVQYRIGENLISIPATASISFGVLSIGCQTFTKTGTRTIREWAKTARRS